MAEVAEAWVSLKPSAKGFGTATVNEIGGEVDKSGKTLGSRFGTALKVGAVAAAGGAVVTAKFLGDAVSKASDLHETVSKIGVVFGKDAAPQVLKFASQGARVLGQTKQDTLDAAATFGTFGKAAQLQGPKLAKFSTGLASLSTDLASFFNTDPKQAAEAIGAALRGEGEPIRQYGVLLDDATLKAEALRIGILKPTKDKNKILSAQTAVTLAQAAYNDAVKKSGANSLEALKAQGALGTKQSTLQKATEGTIPPLTQQQKVLAAQSAIMRQTKDAQGDFQRTSGGLANQQRILAATVDNVQTKLGKLFLPIVVKVVSYLNAHVLPVVMHFVKGLQSGEGAGGKFAAAMQPVRKALASIDWGKALAALQPLGHALASIPWGKAANGLNGIHLDPLANSIKSVDFNKLATGIKSLDFAKLKKSLGSGLNDTISVFSVVIGFAADHVDTLAKYMPLLIGAFIAYKSAVAASKALEIAELPIRLAHVLATLASARANSALATQLGILNGTERVGMVTRLRATAATVASTAATVASTIASKIAAGAAKVWAGAQWLLNAAMSANPIALVVLAVVALVAAFVIAYKKSDTFRAIVTKAFDAIKKVAGSVLDWLAKAVGFVIGWIKDHWKLLVGILLGPLGIVVALVISHWDTIKSTISNAVNKVIGFVKDMGRAIWERIKDVAKFVSGLKDKFGAAVDFVKGVPGKVLDALGDLGKTLYDAGAKLIQGLIDGIKDKVKDVKDAVGNVAHAIGGFFPGSPVKEGPLTKWNGGAAGQRLVGMLATGLGDTRPVQHASAKLAAAVRTPTLAVGDTYAGSAAMPPGAARGGVNIHVENLAPHDYRAFLGDMQRRSQRHALGGFA